MGDTAVNTTFDNTGANTGDTIGKGAGSGDYNDTGTGNHTTDRCGNNTGASNKLPGSMLRKRTPRRRRPGGQPHGHSYGRTPQ